MYQTNIGLTLFSQPKAVVLSPHEAELRMLDVFSEFILVLSSKEPLVLVIDGNEALDHLSDLLFDDIEQLDLQWADLHTLKLLQHLAEYQKKRKYRLLIIGKTKTLISLS